MKSMRLLLLGLLFLVLHGTISAQRGGIEKSPEEWATEQTAIMEEQLVLSSAQKEKIFATHLDFGMKSKAIREDESIDRSMIREKMQMLREENDAELQKYLTSEQWEKWIVYKNELLEQRFRQNKVKETSKG